MVLSDIKNLIKDYKHDRKLNNNNIKPWNERSIKFLNLIINNNRDLSTKGNFDKYLHL